MKTNRIICTTRKQEKTPECYIIKYVNAIDNPLLLFATLKIQAQRNLNFEANLRYCRTHFRLLWCNLNNYLQRKMHLIYKPSERSTSRCFCDYIWFVNAQRNFQIFDYIRKLVCAQLPWLNTIGVCSHVHVTKWFTWQNVTNRVSEIAWLSDQWNAR